MIWRPPRSTLTCTLFPFTTRSRSVPVRGPVRSGLRQLRDRPDPPGPQRPDLSAADDETDVIGHDEPVTAALDGPVPIVPALPPGAGAAFADPRSDEHTSELQSLMRIQYAVLCLQKKTHIKIH